MIPTGSINSVVSITAITFQLGPTPSPTVFAEVPVDATLAPFDGHFIVHGGSPTVLEGSWSADLIVIEFPSYEHASGWYDSTAYQEIIELRAGSAPSTIALVPGVPAGHLATDVLTAV